MFTEKIEFGDNQPFRVEVQKIIRYPIHWHESVTEIILPIQGDVEVVANFEHFTVREGDFHFINNRSVHSVRSADSSGSVAALFHVNLSFFEQEFELISYMFFRSNPFVDSRRQSRDNPTDEKADEKVRFRNLLIDILLRNTSYELSGKVLENLGNRLVYSMLFGFNWLNFLKSNAGMMNSFQMNRYHRIVKYIDDHYRERISLDDIVSSEYITKTYFSHFWKSLSTYSFTERVNYERVLKSEFLLLTNMNILTISEQCGFSDVKYYYQNFKRWYGCLPSEHRLRCLNYNKLGADYEELQLIYFNSELEEYTNKYLFIECNLNGEMTESSYIDNYMKMKRLSNPGALTSPAERYIVLNPFQSNHFLADENNAITFNWHTIDLSVNISMDVGFEFSVNFNFDSIEQDLIYGAIDQFLEGSLNRYGLHLMKKWQFQINYKNIRSFDKTLSIENLILSKVNNAKVVHIFEF
jgi:AraC-like DNA-binding protein